jgi:hemoglobin
MRDAHKHLALSEGHFAAVAENLQATLSELGVATPLVDEVIALVATTHDDVLNL